MPSDIDYKTYREENAQLLRSYLDRTFFSTWKNPNWMEETGTKHESYGLYRSIELNINGHCDLRCAYCYLTKYNKSYYPDPELEKPVNIMRNLNILLDWLEENKLHPQFELFSGETLSQDIGLEVTELLIDRAMNRYPIVIPTNMNFLLSSKRTERVPKLIDKASKRGIPLVLSASVDGKFMEGNRPYLNPQQKRDDQFYEDLFSFSSRYHVGFHPMVYSKGIDLWPQNWLWFQENMAKHEIPFDQIYLLEVRNPEWNAEQCGHLVKFLDFLTEWTFKKLGSSHLNFQSFLLKGRGFNILSSPLGVVGRGMGCSIQTTICLRLGDLSIFPCHRTMYNAFKGGQFTVENGKITGLDGENVEAYLAVDTLDPKAQPLCEGCVIRHLCGQGCLGSQYESTGEIFSPIISVCRLEHAKIIGAFKAYQRIGIYEGIKIHLTDQKRYALHILEKEGLL